MKILLIEEDQFTFELLQNALESQGYSVDTAITAWAGLELAATKDYALILLNPKLVASGNVPLCQQLRTQGYQKPILLLLEDTSTDGVAGLDAGADDYVLKPYNLSEVMARVRALLRRQKSASNASLYWGELCLNPISAEVTYQGAVLTLTPKEYSLLALFLRHPQRVFSRHAILDRIWSDNLPHESTVTNHIKELRQKLKAAGMTLEMIETVYGLGYRLKPPPQGKLPRTADLPIASQPTSDFAPSEIPAPEIAPPEIATSISSINSPGVLAVGDDSSILVALRYLLQPWGLHVAALNDPTEIWDTLDRITPDLLILDLGLTQISGIDLCRSIRQHQKWGDLPILVLTADTNAEAIRWAFAAGADDFVGKPIVGPELVTRVVSRLEQRRPNHTRRRSQLEQALPKPLRPKVAVASTGLPTVLEAKDTVQDTYGDILLVDDQPENLRLLSKILSRQGYKVRNALRGAIALNAIHSQPPDLVVLDVRMPEMNGYEVCATLKAETATRDIPVLFLSALDNTEDKLKAFAVGGADYITKPFQAEEVLARIKHQLIILQQKRQLSVRNRQLQREMQERQQSNATLQQVQQALQESQAQLRTVFEHIPLALAAIEPFDRWLLVNPALCALLGYTEAELLNLPVSACIDFESADGLSNVQQLLFGEVEVEPIALYCCQKSGQRIRVWINTWQIKKEEPCCYIAQFEIAS